MNNIQTYDHFRVPVQPALQSKLEELQLLGYGIVSEEQLWNFLTKKKWKKRSEEFRLSEIVQEIMSLKPSDFMNFQTIEALKESQFSMENEEEWKALLK